MVTWAEILCNMVIVRREVGWAGKGGGVNGNRRVRQARHKPHPNPRPESDPSRGTYSPGENDLRQKSVARGVSGAVSHTIPTDCIFCPAAARGVLGAAGEAARSRTPRRAPALPQPEAARGR